MSSDSMTQRVQYTRYGGPDVLRLEPFTPASPGPGQVLVRVRAAAANPMDGKIRRGEMWPMTGRRFPRGIGHDFAGVVEAVGMRVTHLQTGDAVFGMASLREAGAFADVVVADATSVARKPPGLSFENAATLPVVAVTALQALRLADGLRPDAEIFVHGCLGAVGRSAVQLARRRGATVAGSCRATSASQAAGLGVDPVVDFTVDPTPLKYQFDVVFDTVGSLPFPTARLLIRPGGRIIDIVPTPRKFLRSALPGPYSAFMGKPNVADLEEVADAAEQGELEVAIGRVVPLSDAVAALTEMETGRRPFGGKLVVTTH
jgi:NADPH:quinone reductase-like Zn-dependent oxidoreductase